MILSTPKDSSKITNLPGLVREFAYLDIFLNIGTLFIFLFGSLYLIYGFLKTSENFGGSIKNNEISFNKFMSFLDDLGLDGIKTKKNQRLFEGLDKWGRKKCVTHLFYMLTNWIYRSFLVLAFSRITRYLIRLFNRVSFLIKNTRNFFMMMQIANSEMISKFKLLSWMTTAH